MKVTVTTALGLAGLLGVSHPAQAADQVHDEIQVYNAEIAAIGQWTYEQHLNYAAIGQTQPEFPGGFSSNRSLQGTPEFAYGITDWWEGGFYLPFAVTSTGEPLSDGAKIRSLFVVPDAAKRNFFYGVNFELGYELPPFSPTPGDSKFGRSSEFATRNGNSLSIPSSTLASAPTGQPISLRQHGLRIILVTIDLSASNITPISGRSVAFCRHSSKASNCSPSLTSG